MSDELEVVAAEPAPEQVVTATPAPDDVTPDAEKPAAKTFTQEELDAAIGKRLAREQRKWEREMAQRMTAQQPVAAPKELPSADQFESTEAYAEALALRKAEELVAQREVERQRQEMVNSYQERVEQFRDKFDDFDEVVENPNLHITSIMAATIQASDTGPEVAYFLGTNPKEADRIARLPDFLQAKEIGKLEAKLASEPPVKRPSSAPAPIAPVNTRNAATPAFDTTDPRSIKSMSTSEWIEAEQARERRKLEARYR